MFIMIIIYKDYKWKIFALNLKNAKLKHHQSPLYLSNASFCNAEMWFPTVSYCLHKDELHLFFISVFFNPFMQIGFHGAISIAPLW